MFSGTATLLPGGGGTPGTATLLPSSGGTTGTWGTATLLPTYSYQAPAVIYGPSYSESYAPSYSYQSSGYAPSLPGAGLRAGPFGERGPYTPLDLPLMHELLPGERLETLNPQSGGQVQGSILPYLALGVIAALLLK